MQKINFTTTINASKEKVWSTLWNDATYRQWTSAFFEGSYAITDNWKEGSKVLFVGPDGKNGMVSKVAVNKPNEYMSFEHLGELKDGVEDTTSDAVKIWQGGHENYTLTEKDGHTIVTVDMDITETHLDYFVKTWPVALEKLKQVAESN